MIQVDRFPNLPSAKIIPMKIPYKVSIIIPVYNGSRTLRKTLETAQRQRDPSFEVIVVDDGSTENISSLVRELGARHHRLPMNMGPAAARTEGARVASGQVLLFTDSDVWLPENTISIIRQAFEDHACSCVQGTFSKQCPYPDFFSQYKNLYNRYVLNRLPDWIETTYTSLTAIGREFFFECGGFDQNIRTASVEDRTLGENIIRHGGTIYLEKRLEVIHNKHLSPGVFFRNQFRRSRDLAKLMQRQKASGFLSPGRGFGTHSRESMYRLPAVFLSILCLLLSILTPWMAAPMALCIGAFLFFSRNWLRHLRKEKGLWFALRGSLLDFVDAFVSGCGVLAGLFEYKRLGKKY